jgi:glycosyltransferase involved in cell wall biosynthesis
VRLLVYTTLWPNPKQPHHGIFVRERMRLYGLRHHAPLCVVAPVPLAPPVGPERWRVWSGLPEQEQQDEVRVTHPRFFSPPLLPDRVRAGCLASGSRRRLLDEALRFEPTVLDAHYAWPDGVAAHRLRPLLERHLQRRLPLVITARGTDLNLAPSLPGVREQLAAALRGADHVVCVADALRAVALELGVAPARATTLRNGVDLERFRPGDGAAERAALGLPADGALLLCVGHLIERKGQHLLLEALARRAAAGDARGQLVLVGAGPARGALAARAQRLGLGPRVRFAGAVAPDALPQWYRAADALVLPSLREGWPNVVLEALACGTPVLATKVWGTPEILTGCAAAALVDPTVEGLVAGLEKLPRLDRAAARPWAERHGWEPTLDGMQAIYSRVCAG